MKLTCTVSRLANGNWLARHSGSSTGHVEIETLRFIGSFDGYGMVATDEDMQVEGIRQMYGRRLKDDYRRKRRRWIGDLHPQAVDHARHTTKPLCGGQFSRFQLVILILD
jgi:hypothetical protein